jgi:hypothetical protein
MSDGLFFTQLPAQLRGLVRATSLPQMDFLAVNGGGGADQLLQQLEENEDVSTIDLAVLPMSPKNAATVKGTAKSCVSFIAPNSIIYSNVSEGHRTTQLWFSSTVDDGGGGGNKVFASNKSRGRMNSDMEPMARPPQFSILHATAITGDKAGLQKLAAGKICDIELKDKVCC